MKARYPPKGISPGVAERVATNFGHRKLDVERLQLDTARSDGARSPTVGSTPKDIASLLEGFDALRRPA